MYAAYLFDCNLVSDIMPHMVGFCWSILYAWADWIPKMHISSQAASATNQLALVSKTHHSELNKKKCRPYDIFSLALLP